MKNVKVIVSICLLCICFFPSYGQEIASNPDQEPLDFDNWGKYEKFAEREQGMENFVDVLATAHKLKSFYNKRSKLGLTKETFKQDFLQINKSSSVEKKNLENEIFLVANKLNQTIDRKAVTSITREAAFDVVATLAFNPDFDSMTLIAHNGKADRVPPGRITRQTAEEARRRLGMIRDLDDCVKTYNLCLAMRAGLFAVTASITTLNIQGFIAMAAAGSTPVGFALMGLKTSLALYAMVVTAYYGRPSCQEDLRQCQAKVFAP